MVGFEGTLLEAIKAGVVPSPPLMSFSKFISWRSTEGLRPSKRKDGDSTTPKMESEMWRTTMQELHGDDWREKLDDQELSSSLIGADTADRADEEARPPTADSVADVAAGAAAPKAKLVRVAARSVKVRR